MELDPKLYDDFWKRGWTVVEGVFAASEVERIAELATSLSTVALQADDGAQADRSESGEVAPRKLSSPFLAHEDLRRFELDPRLRSVVGG